MAVTERVGAYQGWPLRGFHSSHAVAAIPPQNLQQHFQPFPLNLHYFEPPQKTVGPSLFPGAILRSKSG